ncbi:hypothetical protein MtrunA17_Chr8g0356561 [Medicago truncatula]|uniref:Uncharacterized protein n=1 Tax=Medicago truncatula TaxID=3880 RepID=A0A396GI20_MEDTR|nr:hypothetical protein MtrunA17_Chr8g0356561 [Medicago truncatula]
MVSWRQRNARTITTMHLGEQVRNSCKKKRSFYCSCTFHCSHTLLVQDKLKLLMLKVEVEADKLKVNIQKMGQWQFCNSYQQQWCLHKNEQLQILKAESWL